MHDHHHSFRAEVFPELGWTFNLKPLVRVFNKYRYGNLEEHFVSAAGQGDVKALRSWRRRGADIHLAGEDALTAAQEGKHDAAIKALSKMGVSKID
jgi:hypothetical protein